MVKQVILGAQFALLLCCGAIVARMFDVIEGMNPNSYWAMTMIYASGCVMMMSCWGVTTSDSKWYKVSKVEKILKGIMLAIGFFGGYLAVFI